MSVVICKLARNSLTSFKKSLVVRYLNNTQFKLTENDVEEIEIPMPWGHIAGKWWGDKSVPPVIAIHGWQDNANSFDKLIPLLNMPSVVAIDLPGHGQSSHLPQGTAYDFGDHVVLLHRIKKYFNLVQMPLLAHSFGAALSYAYSSMFSDTVKWQINFECGRSILPLFRNMIHTSMSQGIDAFLKIEKQKEVQIPPTYKLSKMIEMCIEGSLGSIASPEAALTLLKRGIYAADKPVMKSEDSASSDLADFITYEAETIMSLPKEDQEEAYKIFIKLTESLKKIKEELKTFTLVDGDKYFAFKKDPSVKVLFFQSFDENFVLEASKNIKCPVLSLRAKQGFLFGSTRKLYEKSLDILKTNSRYFEHHDIDGTHHANLNTPELLAPIINSFITKSRRWGPKNKRPILCLHGWQDNSYTFNTLLPHLSPEFSYLAIDLPGHGHSSHCPKGFYYKTYDMASTIRRMQFYFNWNKVSLIGHSYGAACSFLFSSLFPAYVDFFVAIDTIKPLSKDPKNDIEKSSAAVEKLLSYDSRDISTAPAYTENDLLKTWIKGSGNSLTEDSCRILMQRGTEKINNSFKLTRDPRVKISFGAGLSQRENVKLAEHITCNVLFIKAKDASFFEKKEKVVEVINAIKQKAKYFEEHVLQGTHHLHLNNPDVVAPIINSFIKTVGGQQEI